MKAKPEKGGGRGEEMGGKKPTREDLKKISAEHLQHEVTMMVYAAENMPDEDTDKKGHAVALESFLLHARNLIDFLFPRKRHSRKDVVAKHYLSSGERKRLLTPDDFLVQTRKEVHSALAHLSLDRLKRKTPKRWPVEKIANAILARMAAFESTVDREIVAGQTFPERLNLPPRKKGITGSTQGAASFSSVTLVTGGELIPRSKDRTGKGAGRNRR